MAVLLSRVVARVPKQYLRCFSTSSSGSETYDPHQFHALRMKELVLVRHGESEGNVARRRSLEGDHSHYSGDFLNRHSSLWRLTPLGVQHALAAGEYVRNYVGDRYDRYYVSEYLRAMETASLLNLPRAKWYAETFLRERDYGQMDLMSEADRQAKFAEELKTRRRDAFFWCPPGGESLASVCIRVDRLINILHRECADKKVIVVCHGEVMWAFRIRLERMSQRRFRSLHRTDDPLRKIHNCQIFHYSRTNPETGEDSLHLDYIKSVCPWDTSLSTNTWEKIHRPTYSNEELMAEVRYTNPKPTDAGFSSTEPE